MKLLFATSELYPLIKIGGLADVSNNLPVALKNRRQAVRVLLPAYQSVLVPLKEVKVIAKFDLNGYSVRLLETHLAPSRLTIWLVDCPELFNRPGSPYINAQGQDWPDNAQRFGLFCEVAAKVATDELGLNWLPELVHCNDWQTGLTPVYLNQRPASERPKTVFTIHNLAFQGLFSYDVFQALQLPSELWSSEALEYYGQLSFIKGGLVFADQITTVSPRYAEEITTAEFGYGLEGLLQARNDKLTGILNGIDNQQWNPQTDTNLVHNYSVDLLSGKIKNKRALQRDFGLLLNDKAMLIGVVSRLYKQKGIDLLLQNIAAISKHAIQLIILGTGDSKIEGELIEAAAAYPVTVAVQVGYDEQLAHQIVAGADVFAIPSRYEPCGLTQLYSLRYGTLPLVRNVGGLADTVVNSTTETIANNTANGFVFDEASPDALYESILHAASCFADKNLWQNLQSSAMKQDFSWGRSARNYLRLYQGLSKP